MGRPLSTAGTVGGWSPGRPYGPEFHNYKNLRLRLPSASKKELLLIGLTTLVWVAMDQDTNERKSTTSFQLNQGLHRAARESDASISSLAEEGVVHGVVGDLVGVCWLCGNYISKRSQTRLLNADEMDEIAEAAVFGAPRDWKFHVSGDIASDERLNHIAGRMMLTDEPIELCSDCIRLLDEVGYRTPESFPVAYYGRGKTATERADPDRFMLRYAAEVAAISSANLTHLYDQDDEAAFWWAVHPAVRREILKPGADGHRPWRCIARHSNAYWWARGESARPVFEMAVGQISGIDRGPMPDRKQYWPGGNHSVSDISSKHVCSACAAHRSSDRQCSECLYSSCEQCSGSVTVSIDGEVEERCFECGWSNSDPEFAQRFTEMYADVFKNIRRYIPDDRQEDVNRIIHS